MRMRIREEKFMNTKAKAKIGEVLLILVTCLFVGGAICYITGHLPAEQISGIGTRALFFIGVGAGIKRRNSKQEMKK